MTTPHHSVTSFLDILICSVPETHGLLDIDLESLPGLIPSSPLSNLPSSLFTGQLGGFTRLLRRTRGFSLPRNC